MGALEQARQEVGQAAIGRFLPLVTTACAGQVKCKLLVSWNAIDWSVVVQIGGQVTAISHSDSHSHAPIPIRILRQ